MYKFLSGTFKHPLFAPFVIYTLFFLPDAGSIQNLFTSSTDTAMQFSAFDELFQIFAFYIPALALVLYFCFRNTPRSLIKQNYFTDNTVFFTARLKFAALVIPCAACLLLIGAFTVIAGTLLEKVEDFPPVFIPVIESPDSFFAVFVMILSCVIAAYFEESFFRVLLYNSLIASGLQKIPAALAASLLFAVCHAWQGFWGVTGAFLSGVFLAFLFEKNKSLHLIALSHALYNITVYLLVFVKAVIFHGSHYSFLIFHY